MIGEGDIGDNMGGGKYWQDSTQVAFRDVHGMTTSKMHAWISYDLVMGNDMSFVEGTYRLDGGEWQVFIFSPDSSVSYPQVKIARWSDATGVIVKWPPSMTLDRTAVLAILSKELGVTEWEETRGPDSLQLR
jgi:hypothetical protein